MGFTSTPITFVCTVCALWVRINFNALDVCTIKKENVKITNFILMFFKIDLMSKIRNPYIVCENRSTNKKMHGIITDEHLFL